MTREEFSKPAILFVGTQMAIGGAQNLLLSLAEWFHAQGYPVKAAFLYDRDGLHSTWQDKYPFSILNLQMRTPGRNWLALAFLFLSGLASLSRLIRQDKTSVVLAYTHHANLVALPVAWLRGVPVRLASHHGRLVQLGRFLEWLHAGMVNWGIATGLVASSQAVQAQCVREGVRPGRITIIPNGIQAVAIDPVAVESYRHSLEMNLSAHLLVCIGRLVEEKGFIDLLHAMPAVLKNFPGTMLALIGYGPLEASLRQACRDLKIGPNVRFMGWQEDSQPWLAAADLFIMPSRSEGLPVALLEAMSLGCPIVATRVGGIPEALQDGACGELVPACEPQMLGQAVIDLLADPSKRSLLGTAARGHFQAVYSLEQMGMAYEKLIRAQRV